MPDVLWNIHTVCSALRADNTRGDNYSLVIVSGDSDLTFQYDKGLVLVRMMMHRNESTWLQGIEETVTLILKALVEVVVHPQSW